MFKEKSFVEDSLNITKSRMLIFLLKKKLGDLKVPPIFWQKMSAFLHTICLKCNGLLTHEGISCDQLGPGLIILYGESELQVWQGFW